MATPETNGSPTSTNEILRSLYELIEERLPGAGGSDLSQLYSGVDFYGYGNSWMDDAGFFSKLPAKFGFNRVANNATGGYRMQDTAVEAISPGEKQWAPNRSGMVIVNDLGNNLAEADDAANRGAALESARALCAILSAASKTEQADPSWTYSTDPAWVSGALEWAGTSGSSHAVANTPGSYVDIPVPAGDSYLVCYGGNGVEFTTGTWTVTQGAKTFTKATNEKSKITPHRASIGISPVAIKLEGMSAGTARATFSTPNQTGYVLGSIDCLLPQMATPPTLVWIKPVNVLLPEYNKPSLLTYLRTVPDTLAGEFSNVRVIDPMPGWDANSMIGSDQLHPNASGWAHMDAAVSAGLIGRI